MNQEGQDRQDSLLHLFSHVFRLHIHRFHVLLEPFGLYPGQPPLLFVLDKEDGLKQKELAKRLHIQPATLTVMLRRMEGAGFIKRKQDAKDQRVSRVFLTGQGREVCKQMHGVFEELEEDYFGSMTVPERQQLRQLLNHVKDNLLRR